jgi:hypothetical protein
VAARMKHGAVINDLSPEVFKLIVDRLSPVSEDGSRTEALDFACLRLTSRGLCRLCDAAVRRLDLRHCSSDEMRALIHRFTDAVSPQCHLWIFRTIENPLMLHFLMVCSHTFNMGQMHLTNCTQLSPTGGTSLHAPCCFLHSGTEALVLRPSCSSAALQLSQLQPLTGLRSLQLPCAPCRLVTVPFLNLITATGFVVECSGCLDISVGMQRLDRGVWHCIREMAGTG